MTPAEHRKQLRKQRNQLSLEQQSTHSRQALEHFQKWLEQYPADSLNIAFFLAQDGELSSMPAINHLWTKTDHQVFLPVLETSPDLHMGFASYSSKSVMKHNQFGISEPDVPVDTHLTGQQMDIVLVPLVGFDHQGNRLGMGGGYYDRSFAFKLKKEAKGSLLVGWAHSCQQVDKLPQESWDVPLDMMITELGVIEFPTR